jgi:hypothetical protein
MFLSPISRTASNFFPRPVKICDALIHIFSFSFFLNFREKALPRLKFTPIVAALEKSKSQVFSLLKFSFAASKNEIYSSSFTLAQTPGLSAFVSINLLQAATLKLSLSILREYPH